MLLDHGVAAWPMGVAGDDGPHWRLKLTRRQPQRRPLMLIHTQVLSFGLSALVAAYVMLCSSKNRQRKERRRPHRRLNEAAEDEFRCTGMR